MDGALQRGLVDVNLRHAKAHFNRDKREPLASPHEPLRINGSSQVGGYLSMNRIKDLSSTLAGMKEDIAENKTNSLSTTNLTVVDGKTTITTTGQCTISPDGNIVIK